MGPTKKATLSYGEGNSIEFPMLSGTVGPDVVDIRTLYAKTGIFTYDPGFLSTASCSSKITYIDGDAGVLLYRGFPIEQLAVYCDFLEVCYLLLNGELPDKKQKEEFVSIVTHHTMVHEQLARLYTGFRRDSHPMAVMVGVVGALSAFYHDSLEISNPQHREISAFRLIAKMPTIVGMAYKYSVGQPFMYPKNDLSYTGNFMRMMFAVPAEDYKVSPVLVRALDRIFILHADHEQNASTSTVRLAGSSGANPLARIAAGSARPGGAAAGRGPGAPDEARRDRLRFPHPRIHQALEGQERLLPPDGLRPPGLQELRSARQDHAEDLPRGLERARHQGRSAARRRARARAHRPA